MVREQLQNFTVNDFVLNTTLIDNASEIVQNITSNAEPASQGWYGLVVMLLIYMYLLYIFSRNDERFRMDFIKASLYASGFALGVGVIMFSLGWIGNFRHVLWIGLIFVGSFLASWAQRQP